MENIITQTFHKDPSATGTLLRALASRKSQFTTKDAVPLIRVERKKIRIKEKHAEAFNQICGLPSSQDLNLLYPFTLAYPYIMRILCKREMPLSIFKVLNTANTITLHRPLRAGDTVDVTCHNSDLRVTERGIETDITSEIASEGVRVWDNVTTYLVRGKFKSAGAASPSQSLDPIPSAPIAAKWFLPAKDRFRFARISGDTNGIHYCKKYARMFGFERDFSQPIRVVARCAGELRLPPGGGPVELDFFLKGPVYYERHLTLRSVGIDQGHRFDLYCEGNERPCISGKVRRV
jgi:acyl dehydratase